MEPYLSALLMPSVYTIDHFGCEIIATLTNKSPASPYRGVGWTASHTARELLIDRIAHGEGWDPAALRHMNIIRSEDFPYTNVTGMVYDSGSFRESLDLALRMVDYTGFRAQTDPAASPRRRGIGISPYVEPNGWGSEGAAQSHWAFASHDAARVTMDSTGHVTVAVGTPSQGQGHETSLAQLAAATLGVPPEMIEVRNDDTDVTPLSIAGTRASRTAVVTGGAVVLAAEDVRAKLARVGAHLLEAAEHDVAITNGMVHIVGAERAGLPVAQVAAAAYFDPSVRSAEPEPLLSSERFHDPGATYSNGCMVAMVEVDLETGGIDVIDLIAVEDCGNMINPLIVEGQVRGAVVQGLGCALLEEVAYDADGQLLTGTFMDYLLPTSLDSPRVRIGHLESPSPNTVGGIKGMGESGMIAMPAAIANAVADALPDHAAIDRLPVTPDLVTTPFVGVGRSSGKREGKSMKPAPFAYVAPESIDEATAILQEHGDDARLLAGGQSLGPLLNLRLAQPRIIVDTNRLPALDYIRVNDEGRLSLGALTRQRSAETSPDVAAAQPLLTEAIGEIGHRAIRNRGTIGGSIAHADPAAELPACLVALRATFHLVSSATTRDVESVDFFTGPFTTVLETGEILLGITVPPPPIAATQAWLEFSRRHGDFSLIGVAAIIDWAGDGSIADLDLAYSGAYWTPWQPPDEVVAPARGEWPENTVFERVGASAAAASSPPDDIHASAQHRRRLIATLTARALGLCASRAGTAGVKQ